jgi:hypothetical protein
VTIAPSSNMPPASRLLSWAATAVFVGWLLSYNVFRISGSSPRGAIFISLVPGLVLAAIFVAITVVVWRRGVDRHGGEVVIPQPEALDQPSRDALRLAGFAVGALAVVSLVVGMLLIIDWNDTPSAQRSLAKVLVGGWDVVAGLWMATEVMRMVRGQADGVDSVALGSVLTAVLAGVGLSRGWIETAQVVTIVVAGIAAGLCQLALWRATGARGLPTSAGVAVLIAVLSLVLPLAL